MNLEKLHRDTADAIKAVKELRDKATEEGELISQKLNVEGSDDGIEWHLTTRSNSSTWSGFNYYRLPKSKRQKAIFKCWDGDKWEGITNDFFVIDGQPHNRNGNLSTSWDHYEIYPDSITDYEEPV